MGKKERPPPPGPPPVPEWIVTFTDMISLLVTFFVLLMTFSSLEEYDMVKVDAYLFGRSGVLDGQSPVMVDSPANDLVSETDAIRGGLQPHARPSEHLQESLEEAGQKATAEHRELSFDDSADGLVIEFGPDEAFAPASATIPPALQRSLREIGKVLENYRHLIVVEGFTDDAFQGDARYSDAQELAFARARNAADALLGESVIVPERMQVAGLGADEPRAANDSATGRALNRRVQLRLLSPARGSRAEKAGGR